MTEQAVPSGGAQCIGGQGERPQVVEVHIRPYASTPAYSLRELWSYRALLKSLLWRNIRMQYDDLGLGFFWAVARPLAMLGVFLFIKQNSKANVQLEIPYSLYFFSGIILWFLFAEGARDVSRSIDKEAGILKRVYFPRLIPPLAASLSGVYSLFLCCIPLAVMMLFLQVGPGLRILLLPLPVLLCLLLTYGVGTAFAALNAISRDFEKIFQLCLYLGLFVSPVLYSPAMLNDRAQLIVALNPMAGILLSFRSCLFADYPFPLWQFLYSAGFALCMVVVGTRMFRKAEEYFVDQL
ncbi:lipopolysaccharide transport system permease protein [Humidesulfovibrio mexicanus]|uniref:Transport permease protein n=1 Tax=Humidesulfovibrio mexicanus TaxID=147047 RepID=A0A238Y8U1_9BACT|nr:ABC transporter permease [Humidesulfovibrio mexicanus]SNR66759.1 lipopolysaccharide transport system permease protein [Humidesulfovibrio mexicanus]